MLSRILTFVYGAVSYALFVVTFLYAIGFIGNFAVPKSVDSILDGSWQAALLIDLGLLTVFALQHSVMARPGFKRVFYPDRTVHNRAKYVRPGEQCGTSIFVLAVAASGR